MATSTHSVVTSTFEMHFNNSASNFLMQVNMIYYGVITFYYVLLLLENIYVLYIFIN